MGISDVCYIAGQLYSKQGRHSVRMPSSAPCVSIGTGLSVVFALGNTNSSETVAEATQDIDFCSWPFSPFQSSTGSSGHEGIAAKLVALHICDFSEPR